MARISNSKGRLDGNSGYTRIIGNPEVGQLLSRIQSTVISAGTELEKTIALNSNTSTTIEDIMAGLVKPGVYLIPKKQVKKSCLADNINFEADLLVFEIVKNPPKKHCYIIELKDGDNFDTKKSSGEKDNMIKFQNHISAQLPFTTTIHFCCFNQQDKKNIIKGFKGRITEKEAMTGRELCKILRIDYNNILAFRKQDQKENFRFFLDELIKVPEIRVYLSKKLKEQKS